MLQLHKTDEGQQEYAEFLHAPKKRFTDFGKHIFMCGQKHVKALHSREVHQIPELLKANVSSSYHLYGDAYIIRNISLCLSKFRFFGNLYEVLILKNKRVVLSNFD